MKIEQRGFSITDIGERVAGIDVEDGQLRIAMVANVAGDEALTPPITADDVKALIEALTAAYSLMTGDTTPASVRKLVGLKDREGDIWHPTPDGGWAVDAGAKVGRTREWVQSEWGPLTEVFE